MIFEVTVDARTAAEFRAALDQLVRQGTVVSTEGPLQAGTACRLHIVNQTRTFEVNAEASVVKAVPGDASKVLVCPTKFDKPVATAPPAPVAPIAPVDVPVDFENPTAATPLGAPGSAVTSQPGHDEEQKGEPEPEPEIAAFTVLGNYQVLKHLGGGGMAEVYLARSVLGQGVDKLVALKTVRAEFGPETKYGAMFLTEARVSATLQHPNLVQVFDFGEAAGRPYLAMEYVHGRDLGAVLALMRKLKVGAPPAVVVAIGIKLCEALEYVHEKPDLDGRPLNLVHRDVSPANMLVTQRSELKLMDFGVAATGLAGGQTSGLLVGKASHMPPEQMRGLEASASWDLYPVGVTLYQLLTLYSPWQGKARDYLLMPSLRFRRGPPSQVNRQVPPELDALVYRATELEASARHQTAKALREELEAVQQITGPADVGAWLQGMFGEALAKEAHELEALIAEGRLRSERRIPAFLRPLVAPVSALRRRLARRPWLLRGVVALLLLGPLGGGSAAAWRVRDRGLLREQLVRADTQALAGRLTGRGADDALDVLLAAQRRWPSDERIGRRLRLLANRFEDLGAAAIERENPEEASAHLGAALRADPERASVKQKLRDMEELVRSRSKEKVVQSQ